jgi:hypothetical protein
MDAVVLRSNHRREGNMSTGPIRAHQADPTGGGSTLMFFLAAKSAMTGWLSKGCRDGRIFLVRQSRD